MYPPASTTVALHSDIEEMQEIISENSESEFDSRRSEGTDSLENCPLSVTNSDGKDNTKLFEVIKLSLIPLVSDISDCLLTSSHSEVTSNQSDASQQSMDVPQFSPNPSEIALRVLADGDRTGLEEVQSPNFSQSQSESYIQRKIASALQAMEEAFLHLSEVQVALSFLTD
jgi:hypothetical protein